MRAASATKSTPETSASTSASLRRCRPSPSAAGAKASSATCMPRLTTAWNFIPKPKSSSNAGRETGVESSELMSKLLVGNAPCSWGTLEFEEAKGEQIPFHRMLDELAETGYPGTELGDWGYMPTDPPKLRAELDSRGLVMLGAFVPVALKNPSAHGP